MSADLQAVVEAGVAAAEPTMLDDGRVLVALPNDGTVTIVQPIDEKFLDAPRRLRGTTEVHDVGALAYLWKRHADSASVLFADEPNSRFTAVLNDHDADAPGFGDHRVTFELRKSESWRRWLSHDGKWMDQIDFAMLIEDRLIDITDPAGAEMLELAQSLEAAVTADFKSATPIQDGARTLRFEETITAKAGTTGELSIPTTFRLALQPYVNGPAFNVDARFRFRINGGNLKLAFALVRPEDVLREAFTETAEKVGEACSTTTLLGSPSQARA